ncbi:unnamed protein product, partial [Schistocephalus solidus]|uniref:GRIP domain-containing protein n=1 Tax=Schistocephalus solidus TaxID=70667 RepID=A0A183TAL8_SCHSO
WKKEVEWKELLAKEIEGLQKRLSEKEQKLSTQSAQLDEIKQSFLYNFELLKGRDAELARFLISKRDQEISELKVTVDRLTSELTASRQSETEWKSRFEEETSRAVVRETDLRRASNQALSQLSESEAVERRRLQAQITRLEADLEAERARAANDLEAALTEAARRASDVAAEAAQSRSVLETRLRAADEAANLARQEARRTASELSAARETLLRLESELAVQKGEVESRDARLEMQNKALSAAERHLTAAQSKWARLEARRDKERMEMQTEIKELKEALDQRKQELATAVASKDSIIEEAEVEKRRLLDVVARADKHAQDIGNLVQEAERDRQLALRAARLAELENCRLREDLEQALTNCRLPHLGCGVSDPDRQRESQDKLDAQIHTLRETCDRLQLENARLKQAVATMSTQAQLEACAAVREAAGGESEDLLHQNSKKSMEEKNRVDEEEVERLRAERDKLLTISNRLQARLMRQQWCVHDHSQRPPPSLHVEVRQLEVDEDDRASPPLPVPRLRMGGEVMRGSGNSTSPSITGRRSAFDALRLLQDPPSPLSIVKAQVKRQRTLRKPQADSFRRSEMNTKK